MSTPLSEQQKEFLGLAAQYVFSGHGMLLLPPPSPPPRPSSSRIAIFTAVVLCITAIVAPTCSFIWYLAYKERDFADARRDINDIRANDVAGLRASVTLLKSNAVMHEKQIQWLRATAGNPDNKWTLSMETFTLDYLCQQNGLKPFDLKRIHENLMQDFPHTEFPEALDQ
jgi:hypothetical protein